MSRLKIKCGSLEWEASGTETFLTQERQVAMGLIGAQPVPVLGPVAGADGSPVLYRRVGAAVNLSELKRLFATGDGPQVIDLHDELEIKLTNSYTAAVEFAGFDPAGHGYFVFKDCIGKRKMNTEAVTNKGGYYKSLGREYVLNDLYALLPPELKELIVPRKITERINGEAVTYADPLWVPSATDVFGPRTPDRRWWPEEPDCFQLPVFQRERNRVKEFAPFVADVEPDYGTCNWWTRSPYATYAANFCYVYADGNANSNHAGNSYGFAPGFCI